MLTLFPGVCMCVCVCLCIDLDYTAVTRNLTFAAGDRHQCVNISTMDNQVVEGDRMFAVQLVSLEPQRVNISISQAQVTITDNDSKS